jgi:hypothetical protein
MDRKILDGKERRRTVFRITSFNNVWDFDSLD